MKPGDVNRDFLPVGYLALLPLCAPVQSLLTGAAMAVSFAGCFLLTQLTAAMLGPVIATELRIVAVFLVSGTWAALADAAGRAWLLPLWESLDFYVPLVSANALLLARAEMALRGRGPGDEAIPALRLVAAVSATLLLFGLVREILGRGTLLSDATLVAGSPQSLATGMGHLPILQGPPGALLLLALGSAIAVWFRGWTGQGR